MAGKNPRRAGSVRWGRGSVVANASLGFMRGMIDKLTQLMSPLIGRAARFFFGSIIFCKGKYKISYFSVIYSLST